MKDIVVWGTGESSARFVLTHPELNVVAFINDRRSLSEHLGRPAYSAADGRRLIERYYTVIATRGVTFWTIKVLLEDMGRREFDDFCFSDVYEKKIAIFYGNCHIVPIQEGVGLARAFNDKYGIYPFRPLHVIWGRKLRDLESTALEHCDLLIHQDVQDNNALGSEYAVTTALKRVKCDCETLSMPNLYKLPKCFFPQQIKPAFAQPQFKGGCWFPHDRFIHDAYEKGRSKAEIIEMIMNENVVNSSVLLNGFEQFVKTVRARESACDVKIADWILKNYTKEQLFYDIEHPTTVVLRQFVISILSLLGMKGDEHINIKTRLDHSEVPVYGQVMRTFHIEWKNSYILRDCATMWKLRPYQQMDLVEYVDEYIEWYYGEPARRSLYQ